MKVYQTIHKYPPHIPLFEKRHGLCDHSAITFAQLQKLIIEDGYAASYILEPALQGRTEEVFFTIWDYERLQFLWAEEHGIESRDLSVIKKAQIDWFKPDVFYNHSAFCDDNFISHYTIDPKIIKICWYGIISDQPESFFDYNIRLSLHKPFIQQWNDHGLLAYEVQPSFYEGWSASNNEEKEIDLLFFGQTGPKYFKKRNIMLEKLLVLKHRYNIQLYLTIPAVRLIYNLPFLRDYYRFGFVSRLLNKYSLPPVYGTDLYNKIGISKFTLNGYTNYNKDYKSNMRLFEALGCGSLLISEMGNYPEGFVEGKHFIGYKDSDDLLNKLPEIIDNYELLKREMQPHIEEVKERYSKARQWQQFKDIVKGFTK